MEKLEEEICALLSLRLESFRDDIINVHHSKSVEMIY